MTIKTTIIPPQINQHFNRNLLSFALPGMREPKSYRNQYEAKAKRKYGENSKRMREFNETLEIYEILYEWKKAQEAYDKAKTKDISKRPLIPAQAINRLRGELGKNIRSAFASYGLYTIFR